MTAQWNVTYEIFDEESVEYGEPADQGFRLEAGTLRDALRAFAPSDVYADCYPVSLASAPRWFSTTDEPSNRTGDTEGRALHIPPHITASSRVRLARLLQCYGIR